MRGERGRNWREDAKAGKETHVVGFRLNMYWGPAPVVDQGVIVRVGQCSTAPEVTIIRRADKGSRESLPRCLQHSPGIRRPLFLGHRRSDHPYRRRGTSTPPHDCAHWHAGTRTRACHTIRRALSKCLCFHIKSNVYHPRGYDPALLFDVERRTAKARRVGLIPMFLARNQVPDITGGSSCALHNEPFSAFALGPSLGDVVRAGKPRTLAPSPAPCPI